jgi:uroporphyrinogen decarboxylase
MVPESEWRIGEILAGRLPDRVPVFLFELRGFAAVDAGVPIGDAYRDAVLSYDVQSRAIGAYRLDTFPRYSYGAYGAWEFGGEVRFPESEWQQAPAVTRYPVMNEQDALALTAPDPSRSGCMPIALAFSALARSAGTRVMPPITGVFTTAGNVAGLDKLCRWVIRRPTVAHRLLQVVTEHLVQVTQLWVNKFGSDIWSWTAEPSCSNQVISPRVFEEFVLPYETELHTRILKTGIRHIMAHICGDQNLNLPHWAKIPMGEPGVATFGHEVDLEYAIKYMGHSCVIAGNVEPALLQTANRSDVLNACAAAIHKGKQAPLGFVLMPGCSTPPYASQENMRAMVQAAEQYGCY